MKNTSAEHWQNLYLLYLFLIFFVEKLDTVLIALATKPNAAHARNYLLPPPPPHAWTLKRAAYSPSLAYVFPFGFQQF